MSAAMKLERASQHGEENGPRHDPVELLSRPEDVRRTREDDRKAVAVEVRGKAHVACRARHGIGRGRIERRALANPVLARSVDFRRREMDIPL